MRSSDLRLARRLAEQGYDIIEMARRALIAAQAEPKGPVSAAARSAISARKRRYQAERRKVGRK